MSSSDDINLNHLHFFITTEYPCGYLKNQKARSLVAAPAPLIDHSSYSRLIQLGFRRNGLHTYRPYCDQCQNCIPVRLRISDFTPSRSQKRTWKRHQMLQASVYKIHFNKKHFQLYTHYQRSRHFGDIIENDNADQYRNFLLRSNVNSALIEFHENDQLRLVSLIDILSDGISAVYSFYDVSVKSPSYGTYNIIWLAEYCREHGFPYLYLGYWIADSRKMAYKTNFKPLEQYNGSEWQKGDG